MKETVSTDNKIEEEKQEIEVLQRKIDALQKELDRQSQKIDLLLQKANANIPVVADNSKEEVLMQEIFRLKNEIAMLKAEVVELQNTMDKNGNDALYAQIRSLEQQVAKLETKNYTLQIKLDAATIAHKDLFSTSIYFDVNSSAIKDTEVAKLIQIADAFKTGPINVQLKIQGFADKTGAADYNMKLSKKRAQSVTDYLTTKCGVDPNRVRMSFYGQEINNFKTNDAESRRVDLELVK